MINPTNIITFYIYQMVLIGIIILGSRYIIASLLKSFELEDAKILKYKIFKPLGLCYICMTSIWGFGLYYVFFGNFTIVSPFVIFGSATFSVFIDTVINRIDNE